MKNPPSLLVLDTSAIMARNIDLWGAECCIPPSVIDEIKLGKLKRDLDNVISRLKVIAPSEESRNAAHSAAARKGDDPVLSSTDIDVIALGLQSGGTVVTDDFAIQNVCRSLGIAMESATGTGIREEISWTYRCTGCRKIYSEPVAICSVCGHEVKRVSRKNPARKKKS